MKRLFVFLSFLFVVNVAESPQWSIEYPCDENESVIFITGDMSAQYNYVLGTMYEYISDLSYPIALWLLQR